MNRIDKMCGFTLIEIILAIAVVAISLTGLIGAISFVTKQNVQTEIQTTATELAQERMEQLVAEKIKNGLNSAALALTPSPSYVPISGFPGYEQMTEVCYANIPVGGPGVDVMVSASADGNIGITDLCHLLISGKTRNRHIGRGGG